MKAVKITQMFSNTYIHTYFSPIVTSIVVFALYHLWSTYLEFGNEKSKMYVRHVCFNRCLTIVVVNSTIRYSIHTVRSPCELFASPYLVRIAKIRGDHRSVHLTTKRNGRSDAKMQMCKIARRQDILYNIMLAVFANATMRRRPANRQEGYYVKIQVSLFRRCLRGFEQDYPLFYRTYRWILCMYLCTMHLMYVNIIHMYVCVSVSGRSMLSEMQRCTSIHSFVGKYVRIHLYCVRLERELKKKFRCGRKL